MGNPIHVIPSALSFPCCGLQVRIQGGGGGTGGLDPPPLCHDVGFLTLGPKLDPRLAPPFLLVDLIWTPPPFQKSWIRPCTLYTWRNLPMAQSVTYLALYHTPQVAVTTRCKKILLVLLMLYNFLLHTFFKTIVLH